MKAVGLSEAADLERMEGGWINSEKGVKPVKQVGEETRGKKIRWWINWLTLRRQVTEMWSEKTLETNPDWGLE